MNALQNLVESSDKLSGVVATILAGAPIFTIDGIYLMSSDQSGKDAKKELIEILHKNWLDNIHITPLFFDIQKLDLGAAHLRLGITVPQPTYDFWKLTSRFAFKPLTLDEWKDIFDFLKTSSVSSFIDGFGSLQVTLMGGKVNRIDASTSVMPAREGAVAWFHMGTLWRSQNLKVEQQSLGYFVSMVDVIQKYVSKNCMYNTPDTLFGSQLTTPPNYNYVKNYWMAGNNNFVQFLLETKKVVDPINLFKFSQSIPLA